MKRIKILLYKSQIRSAESRINKVGDRCSSPTFSPLPRVYGKDILFLKHDSSIQCSCSGWPTGYGKKLSSSQEKLGQATCLAVA